MKNIWILNNKGDFIASFQILDLENRYAFKRVETMMNVEWLEIITKGINHTTTMKEWLAKGKYLLMGVKIPRNKGRHFPFRKSQLDSQTFGMAGSTGLWTRYHLSLWFGVL